ncbi:PREDICTED: probable pectinesterase 53 [Erythranthe guttata]|uniref:probable pectinesterase 53 n=1 Tax=Erythranthe guttata TaxID=4155 RepID=UPI00064DD07C|nr:PREDICTED: probable pectinesterase 53 [Erythranthe guttata]|eukprot:XP_012849442.1 PREDICTED: probable pectinesterase 53 [Erythranthe guttata]
MSPYTHILHLVTTLILLLINGNNEIIICYSNKVIMKAPSIIIIVDKNPGSVNFTSIQGAIDSLPLVNQERVLIDVHAGIYTEKVTIPSTKAYIKIQGAGAENTVVQWGDTARTVTFEEYQCCGPGSNTAGRVKWSKILTDEEAGRFTSLDFIDASQWLDLS